MERQVAQAVLADAKIQRFRGYSAEGKIANLPGERLPTNVGAIYFKRRIFHTGAFIRCVIVYQSIFRPAFVTQEDIV